MLLPGAYSPDPLAPKLVEEGGRLPPLAFVYGGSRDWMVRRRLCFVLTRDTLRNAEHSTGSLPSEFRGSGCQSQKLELFCADEQACAKQDHKHGERVIAALRERGLGADATLTTLKLAGHHVMLDDPVGFNAAVLAAADS